MQREHSPEAGRCVIEALGVRLGARLARVLALASLAPFALAGAPPLVAGTVLLAHVSTAEGSRAGQVFIQGGNLRLESSGQGPVRSLIFRGKTGTTWVIEEETRSYVEAGRGEADLPGVPAIAGAPAGPGGAEAPLRLAWRKVASGVRINGFTTDRYEATLGAEKVKEAWMADPAALEVTGAGVAALVALARVVGERSPGGAWSFTAGEGGPAGIAIRVVRYEQGKRVWGSEVTGFLHRQLPESLFAPPRGYRKRAAPH